MTPPETRLSAGDCTRSRESGSRAEIVDGRERGGNSSAASAPRRSELRRNSDRLRSARPARLRSERVSPLPPPPLTWFSVVGMMSGVCGSIVENVLACLASSSNQSGLPARAAGDIIMEIGDGRPRKENTLAVHTVRSITSRTPTVLLSLTLYLSFSLASLSLYRSLGFRHCFADAESTRGTRRTRGRYTDAWDNVCDRRGGDPEKSFP